MQDPRLDRLAKLLVEYSVDLKPGEILYLEVKGMEALELGRAVIEHAARVGGVPFWYYNDETVSRPFIMNAEEEQFQRWGQFHRGIMEQVDAYIAIRGSTNPYDLSDVDPDHMRWHDEAYWNQVHLPVRLKKKWCVLRYPNPAMAMLAQRSTEEFADFYFKVCTVDYAAMSKAMDPLVELMEATDQVHIVGPGTDLTMSIAGIPVVKSSGRHNIPDGEVYTAPVRDSVNGVITYNAASINKSTLFKDIRFVIERGKIVEATCSGDVDKLNQILDTDEGARYFGEFALGLNPHITKPMQDTLFDEKIMGSFHFTPGNAYEQADNGNRSAIHWDLVSIQTEEWGGGEIWFDGKLIRKDGRFVIPELEPLNPENLG